MKKEPRGQEAAPSAKKAVSATHQEERDGDGQEGGARQEGGTGRQEDGTRRPRRRRRPRRPRQPAAAKKAASRPRRPRRPRRRAADGSRRGGRPAAHDVHAQAQAAGAGAAQDRPLRQGRQVPRRGQRAAGQPSAPSTRSRRRRCGPRPTRWPSSASRATCSSTRSRARAARSRSTASATWPCRARRLLAVEEIDDAARAHRRQDLRLLRALLPAHPQAAPAGASLRPPLRGVQERGAVAALTRTAASGGVRHRRRRRGGRPGDHLAGRGPPARRHATSGGPSAWPSPSTRASPSASSAGGPSWSRCCSCIGVVVLAVVVARVRTVPQAIGGGLVLGGAVGNLSERIVGGPRRPGARLHHA